MIKAVLIDDERLARTELRKLLMDFPEIEIVGEAANAAEGLESIENLQPDLVFLDIQMPGKTGFDMLSELEKSPHVIFTTAYDEYALKAFEVNALDYLLKPIDETELKKAVERFKAKRIYAPAGQQLFRNFIQNISQGKKEKFKLALADASEVKYVTLDEIIRLQADSNYTKVHLTQNRVFVSAKTLKEYDEILKEQHFLRIHKSHLINPTHIESYDKQGWLKMSDGSEVEVARRKKEYVQEALKNL